MAKGSREVIDYHVFTAIMAGKMRYDEHYGKIHINQQEHGTQMLLENCDIALGVDALVIKSTPSPLKLTFKNCRFNTLTIDHEIKELEFYDCTFQKFSSGNRIIERLTCKKNRGVKEIFINADTVSHFVFDGTIKMLKISGSSMQVNSAELSGFIETMQLSNLQAYSIDCFATIKSCFAQSCKYPFKDSVIIETFEINLTNNSPEISGLFYNLSIINHHHSIYLTEVTCLGNLKIIDAGSPADKPTEIYLAGIYVGETLSIIESTSDLKCGVNNDGNQWFMINELCISGSLGNLDLKSSNDQMMMINKLAFRNVHLIKDKYWFIQGLYCNHFSFIEFRNAGSGNISNTLEGKFTPLDKSFDELISNYKGHVEWNALFDQLQLNPGDFQPIFELRSSDLGKISFIDSDFSEFKMLFYSTKMNEIFLAGSKMPRVINALDIGKIKSDLNHQVRIANSQLKKLHEQQGDLLAANIYFSNEMNAFNDSLNWRDDFWEKLPLWLNKYSSNHGESWIIALKRTLQVSGVLYILFLWSLGYTLAWPWTENSVMNLLNAWAFVLDFINPIHKLDTFEPLTAGSAFSGISRFTDGVSRIFIAYFVYQLIQAFRKHGRSK